VWSGRDGALFAQAGHRVAGIDRSAGMLAIAAGALPGRVMQADLRSLPVAGEALDGIWCCAALLHVLRVLAMTGESTSRDWLKVLARAI
jgi:ubiquinone/menaquinone biosynthesis C-methylase UbiE